MKLNYKQKIGYLIQNARQSRNLTQKQLAEALGTSQSAINRIEKGGQNISLEMLAKISDVLSSELISLNLSGKLAFKINGGKRLAGSIDVKTSKNAAVGLLCASLLNHGTTIIRRVAKIEEVNRIIEVLNSLGVKTRWLNQQNDLEIKPPARLKLTEIDEEAAKKTGSVLDSLTGQKYLQEILEVGGSRPAAESFKAFRGREPQIDALLRHGGLA